MGKSLVQRQKDYDDAERRCEDVAVWYLEAKAAGKMDELCSMEMDAALDRLSRARDRLNAT